MPTSPPSTPPVQPTTAPPLQHFTLDNGFTVILLEDHRAPLVTAQLWYHVGASDEPLGQSGLSHALEHLVFDGSDKLPQGQYSSVLARLGAAPRAFTLDDATLYLATVPVNRLEIVLEAQADIMANAHLSAQAFAGVRTTLMNEHRLSVASVPDEQANAQHLRLAHGDSPYARSHHDVLDDLQTLTSDSVKAWYARHYHPDNATLVVAGDLQLAALRELVERHFAPLPKASLERALPFRHPAALGERSQTVRLPGLRPSLALSFNVPSLGSAASAQDVYALQVALAVLSTGASSRLYAALVREQPLLRGVHSEFDLNMRGDTLLTLRALVSPDQTVQHASERVLALIESLSDQFVSPAELQRAKTQLLAEQVFRHDALQQRAYDVGRHVVGGASLVSLMHARQSLEAVSAQDLQRVARHYLNRDHLTLTYSQPEATAQ
ncbi:pitrilysin family protein [Pseudomonas sp.]|uniref:M16 family metallopeptidase n=1 Tax=Pseudomonas sp. TaxID=306 RepID=UPI0028AD7D8F|nr:pitrilysin family protein [Pseudomonas sp.]